MIRGRAWSVAVVLAVTTLSGCTSGSSSHAGSSSKAPSPTVSSTASPSARPSVTPTASLGTFAPSAPATSASPTVTKTPTPSAPGTSADASATRTPDPATVAEWAKDPAVKALRAWFAEAARTVNKGSDDSPALDKLMTGTFRLRMPHVLGDDVGLHYPGPIPYEVESVSTPSPGQRLVEICAVFQGFAEDAKTHEPAAALSIQPAVVRLVTNKGQWLVNELTSPLSGSCQGKQVAMPLWPKTG